MSLSVFAMRKSLMYFDIMQFGNLSKPHSIQKTKAQNTSNEATAFQFFHSLKLLFSDINVLIGARYIEVRLL